MQDKVQELADDLMLARVAHLNAKGDAVVWHNKEVEALIRAKLKPLRDKWQALKPIIWESSFADKDYEHTNFTRALIALAEEIESL